mgnify:CR=1 FL=1
MSKLLSSFFLFFRLEMALQGVTILYPNTHLDISNSRFKNIMRFVVLMPVAKSYLLTLVTNGIKFKQGSGANSFYEDLTFPSKIWAKSKTIGKCTWHLYVIRDNKFTKEIPNNHEISVKITKWQNRQKNISQNTPLLYTC